MTTIQRQQKIYDGYPKDSKAIQKTAPELSKNVKCQIYDNYPNVNNKSITAFI